MKTFTQFINETDNGVDLKKAVKRNGFTIPTSFKYVGGIAKIYNYYSKQGFRGETTIRGTIEKLEAAGWTKFDDYDKFTPDGSRISYHSVLISPDKSVLFKSNCSYGGTSWDNYYKGEFILTSDEEDKLTMLNVRKEFAKVFSEIGFRAYMGGDGVGEDTVKQDSEGRPVAYFGMYLPSKSEHDVKIIDGYKQKLSSWEKIGEDKWEKGDWMVEIVPDREGSNFRRFAITYIGNVKRVKL